MKILSLSTIPLLPYLGSGKTRLMWTQGLRDRGHDVTVLQPSDFEFMLWLKKATQLRMAIGVFIAVGKVLRRNRYDLVEFYGDQYWLLLWWEKKIRRNKTLFIAHVDGIELHDMDKEQQYYNPRKGFRKWFYNQTHRRFAEINFALADRYVCGCNDDLQYALKNGIFKSEHASCISPGIDKSFHDIPYKKDKEKVISFLGTWWERKGILLIPEVITKVLELHPDYKFHIYGSWSLKEHILSSFPQHVQSKICIFSKLAIDELYDELGRCAIFFFPSYSEGFGLATVEAMSCSNAVVTTKTGIGLDLIDGEEVLLVNFNDTKAMIVAIDRLIIDEDYRQQIAYNGFKKAKQFVWQAQVELLELQYLKWLKA